MADDSLWALTHPRNAAIERAFADGSADNGSKVPTWPGYALDTIRGADWALNREYMKARFAFAPAITSVLERDMEAIRELSDGEIREHAEGKLDNMKELLAWREEQQRGGPKR